MKFGKDKKSTLYVAGQAALKKIAGEGLFQYTTIEAAPPAAVASQDEEKKEQLEKLSKALTASNATRGNVAVPAKKQEAQQTPPAAVEPTKEQAPAAELVEVVDWQATAKVMQSVASVALELMRELEAEELKK